MNEYYVGTIGSFGFGFIPLGWAACNGQLLPIAEYDVLFTLIGTTYGGDGQSTFALPDLRGRTILNQGQGPGLTMVIIGESSGSDAVTMTNLTMPGHTHPLVPGQVNAQTKMFVTTAGSGTNEPEGKYSIGAGGSFTAIFSDSSTIGNSDFIGGVQLAAPVNTFPIGNNVPLDITNPMLGLNFCINLYGIFPTQN